MYAARKSGLKKEMFGYVTGGYNVINEKFAQYLIGLGVEFRLNSKVKSITPEQNKRVRLQLNQDQIFDFDHIISTLSPGQSVKLAASLPKEEKIKHNNIKYLGVICPSVLMKKPVSPYYVTNITDTGVPFTGIIELTALIDKEKEMKGKNLVYLPKYVNPDDPLFESNDEDIRKIFLGTLLDMYPQISAEDILYFGVARSRIVFALPTIGYSLNLPGIRTSIDNFFIINSAQIINGTLNVNETIQVAESKLREIL